MFERKAMRTPVVVLIAALLLSACASESPIIDADETPTPTPSISASVVQTNVLSGRPGDDGPVLVVKIDDSAAAHPQIGLEEADVVYVEQVEAGLTRLAAVFSSSLPPRVGPVRSARISDIDIMANYGRVAFAYSGAQSRLYPIISKANLIDLGAQRQSPSIYTRDYTRRSPVNMVLLPKALLDKAAERGLVPDLAKSVGWTFGERSRGGTQIQSVEVRWPGTTYRVLWNGRAFTLFQDGRLEQTAAGNALSPTTVVVQMVRISPSKYGDRFGGVTPQTEVVGSGAALVLRDGVAFRATWKRSGLTEPTTFTDAGGETLPFAGGHVWVLLADQSRAPLITTAGPSPVKPPESTSAPKP
jgi:hypothetical protein